MKHKSCCRKIRLFLQILLVSLFIIPLTSVVAKPAPSVKLSLGWESEPVENQHAQLNIHVVSHVSSDQLNIRLLPPSGIRITEGKAEYVFTIKKGEPREISVRMFIEEKAVGKIRAEAVVKTGGNSYFSASDSVEVDFSGVTSRLKARMKSEPEFQETERNGVQLREYRLSQ